MVQQACLGQETGPRRAPVAAEGMPHPAAATAVPFLSGGPTVLGHCRTRIVRQSVGSNTGLNVQIATQSLTADPKPHHRSCLIVVGRSPPNLDLHEVHAYSLDDQSRPLHRSRCVRPVMPDKICSMSQCVHFTVWTLMATLPASIHPCIHDMSICMLVKGRQLPVVKGRQLKCPPCHSFRFLLP